MKTAFPQIEQIAFEGPAPPKIRWRSSITIPRKSSPARRCATTCVFQWFIGTRFAAPAASCLAWARCSARGTTALIPSATPRTARAPRSNSSKTRRAVLRVPRPRRCPGRQDACRDEQEPRRRRQGFEGGTETHRHQIALGHGEPVFQSALVHGASTSCNADVFAYAGAQVKKALEVTHELGGAGYVFWGGREGYSTLWNTNMKRELEHLAKSAHGGGLQKENRLQGPVYIEPKPKNRPSTNTIPTRRRA